MYCDDLDSVKRKNCIKVLSIILEFLLKWFSPILVFTCEEIYPNNKKTIIFQKVFFYIHFAKFPNNWTNKEIEKQWDYLKKLKIRSK